MKMDLWEEDRENPNHDSRPPDKDQNEAGIQTNPQQR
jgi:hypothetical protein